MNAKTTAAVGAALVAAAASVGMLPPPKDDPALSKYQMRCAQAISYFITQIPRLDGGRSQVTLGEAHRPQWVATEYARKGLGISTSLHIQRLAFDLMLFKDGQYQAGAAAYKPMNDLWLEIGPAFGIVPGAGYYFGDANHVSCAYGGRK